MEHHRLATRVRRVLRVALVLAELPPLFVAQKQPVLARHNWGLVGLVLLIISALGKRGIILYVRTHRPAHQAILFRTLHQQAVRLERNLNHTTGLTARAAQHVRRRLVMLASIKMAQLAQAVLHWATVHSPPVRLETAVGQVRAIKAVRWHVRDQVARQTPVAVMVLRQPVAHILMVAVVTHHLLHVLSAKHVIQDIMATAIMAVLAQLAQMQSQLARHIQAIQQVIVAHGAAYRSPQASITSSAPKASRLVQQVNIAQAAQLSAARPQSTLVYLGIAQTNQATQPAGLIQEQAYHL